MIPTPRKPHRLWVFLRRLLSFVLNPRLLLCLALAWFVTNGWSYLFILAGIFWDIPWMAAVGGAYAAFLWFPFTPEKILTAMLAILLLRWWFPRDQATLQVLRDLLARARAARKKGPKSPDT